MIADEKILSARTAESLLADMTAYKAFLVGPGLGQADDFMATLLTASDGDSHHLPKLPPMIVDADGLNLLAETVDWSERLPAGTILTPHMGEMARLMGVSLEEAKGRDRVDLAREKAAEWNSVVLLKGAYTAVS